MTEAELLKVIDKAVRENATSLDLSNKNIKTIPPEIAQLTNLTELDLAGNDLTELPPEIGRLQNLETLILGKLELEGDGYNVKGNKVVTLPDEIAKLTNLTRLDLSNNQITEIPDAIAKLTNLTRLDLSNNQITEIPDAIAKLTNLIRLDLSNNQIIAKLTNLTWLYLSSNQITEIPDAIAKLTNLTELNLSSNQITEIPDAIAKLTNLTELNLSSNQITKIPDAIAKLTNLTELNLSSNQITEIPDEIAKLTNLTWLYLYNNQITEIPDEIAKLTNLTKLYLFSNQFTEIPDEIAKLTNLTGLDLSNNQITEIPDEIAKLTNLTWLDLSNNQITEIPDEIAKLTNLTGLDLSDNQITEIPDEIAKLTNLTELNLSDNQITEILDAIAKLTNLTELNLSDNQITEIPDEIAQLTNFTVLYLSGNQITEIPDAIAKLTNFTELYLSGNQITEIPDAIAKLTNLTWLDLSNNQIKEIPDAITKLTNLTELNLSYNQITEIPDALEGLSKLEQLDLRGNPLPILPEILGSDREIGSVEDILNYFRQLRSGEVRPLNEAKLILIGQGSVGKTSLLERLIYDKFNPNQPQTDGLNVQTWEVHVNSKDVRLNIWDFGGQEIYHATHQFFLTKRSLYLLVCNCRTSEEENRIEYWLKLIDTFGDKSPVILVGNKSDEQPLDINRKALREKYPNIKAIIETSCQDNKGIEELRDTITNQVGLLSDVYNLLPLSWFEVKQHLEDMKKDFITYNEYIGICYQKNITDDQNQTQLIGLLHNLGLVLNFREHPILQHTNVLKPNWVTEGIYALLSDETLKTTAKGIFTPADLSRILDPHRYPTDRHDYLIKLMIEFQLCFAIECNPPQFLIPGLLPKDEPEETDLRGEILEFQYHYRVLPESIISRFIVNTHAKIHNQTYWRSGVMLHHKEGQELYNIAVIKADPEDRKIFISISGRESTRRSFLAIIREAFNKIHNTFANPEITEWVPVPNYPDHDPLKYTELLGLEAMGETHKVIGELKLRLDLRQLLDGYESRESRQKLTDSGDKSYEDYRELAKIAAGRPIKVTVEAKAMSQGSQYTNNLQGANIGNIANELKDQAQQTASNFIQTSGTNTAELLQIINSLRQATEQFPADIREDMMIEIDDVETEIKKPPEQRSNHKLKKRLTALLIVVGSFITQIPAATDFMNNALDLSSKLNIELLLPQQTN